jgi:glycoside hydrolase-like protein/VCBS repeat protein
MLRTLGRAVTVLALVAVTMTGGSVWSAPAPGAYTGAGFDACSAPSTDAMTAWLASPYRAVGIYFGGANRGCAQPNLTPSWVATQQAAGWHLIPIYFGLQAPCTTSTKPYRIDPANAVVQGRAQAEDAVAQAKALGLAPESGLIFDMEAYRTDDPACRSAVLSFTGAWTSRLHDLGYLSGFYSSMASGVADQVANYDALWYAHPDYLDFARWDGVATVSDPAIPASYWSPQRRMKQYRGGHDETWGGVTINIDNDQLDLAPIPASPFGDFTGNGWPDLLARQTSNGGLYLYPGDGGWLGGSRAVTGWGWNILDAITRHGDVNRDGYEDVFGREKATGYLWLYTGTGSTFSARVYFGAGWNTVREITAVGDFNRDGYADVVAADKATGALYLYAGNAAGTAFTTRTAINWGWNTVDELTGVGDFDGDGYVDLVARDPATGYLYLYPGTGTGLRTRVYLGAGWNTVRDLAGIGDFNRDGHTDLVAIEKSTGILYLYLGDGTGITRRANVGTGWAGMQPIL